MLNDGAKPLLLQPHGFEGLGLGAEVLPAHDLLISELEDAADPNVYLDATLPCPHLDLAPRDDPLTEVKKIGVDLELLEDLLGVRAELLYTHDPAIRPLRPRSLRQDLDIRVKDRAKLSLVALLDGRSLKDTTHELHVLLRHLLLLQPHGFEGLRGVCVAFHAQDQAVTDGPEARTLHFDLVLGPGCAGEVANEQ